MKLVLSKKINKKGLIIIIALFLLFISSIFLLLYLIKQVLFISIRQVISVILINTLSIKPSKIISKIPLPYPFLSQKCDMYDRMIQYTLFFFKIQNYCLYYIKSRMSKSYFFIIDQYIVIVFGFALFQPNIYKKLEINERLFYNVLYSYKNQDKTRIFLKIVILPSPF